METEGRTAARDVPVRFSGDTGEYFRIWIVNTALTIVTLGVYSAWAKVRKLRYFYSHTAIEDGHFDFHANPVGILVGRIVAVGMLGAYFGASYLSPILPFAVLGFIFLLVPWLVVRTRVFHMRNTSLHGLRFNFQPNYTGAFKAFYGGALLTVLTLGFGAPSAMRMRQQFVIDNSAYGRTPFSFKGESGEFYAIVWKGIGLTVIGVICFIATISVLTAVTAMGQPPGPDEGPGWIVDAASVLMLFVYIAVAVYIQVRIRNYVWNFSNLGANTFVSTLSVRRMLSLYLTNLVAIVCSVGLLVPWAQIRLARYRASELKLHVVDDWQTFLAAERGAGSALGDEIGEAFDVGIDFAV